jgi:hypothetical protein
VIFITWYTKPQIRVRIHSSLSLNLARRTLCIFSPFILGRREAFGLLLPRWVHFRHEPPLPPSSSSPRVSFSSSFVSRPCPLLVAAAASFYIRRDSLRCCDKTVPAATAVSGGHRLCQLCPCRAWIISRRLCY